MLFKVGSYRNGTAQALSTSDKTVLAGFAQTATLRRGKIMEARFGPRSDPAATDCNILYSIQRQTADGTGTSVTPAYGEAIEAGTAPAAGSAWKANYTVEGTYTDILFDLSINQHSGFHYYAPDDRGIPWPAVNNQGVACRAMGMSASYTGTAGFHLTFEE